MKQDTHYALNPYSLYIRLGKRLLDLLLDKSLSGKMLHQHNSTKPTTNRLKDDSLEVEEFVVVSLLQWSHHQRTFRGLVETTIQSMRKIKYSITQCKIF